ncbi:hypothetical protein [Pseudomonas fluorescens]|uniref:hypothetical protein n=1 Tax=Pseudomonas fluorescens TaxID=294 RepID=UPI0012425A9B|nr:hypothetical protein [Pseudomonas fluorescens]
MADVEAFSVDPLCVFGAKNFLPCAEFTQVERLSEVNSSLLISHFGVFCRSIGSVMVRQGEKCLIRWRAASFSLALMAAVQGSS